MARACRYAPRWWYITPLGRRVVPLGWFTLSRPYSSLTGMASGSASASRDSYSSAYPPASTSRTIPAAPATAARAVSASSLSASSTLVPEWSRMSPISSALSRVLSGTSTAPAQGTPLWASSDSALLGAHNGVPWAGAVLVPLNTRLNAEEIGDILDHSGTSVLLADSELADTARAAVAGAAGMVRLVEAGGYADEYESLLADAEPLAIPVSDEYGLLSVNYTSGTTGRPKGVMYHHRGAYLQALAMAFHNQLTADSVYLWTLPMFHCSGWCFTWGVTAAAARHVCLRKVDPDRIWQALRTEGVTHFSAAPTVLTMLGNSRLAGGGLDHTVEVTTGGAPPSPALLARMADLGVHMTHLYGLTETYGPVVISEWHREWDALEAAAQAQLKARQGVANVVGSPVRVLDQDAADVPADGVSLGEIALRGNNVMLGYYRDPDATAEATADGYFRTGDLGVVHPDGYVELTDRSKDVIISGGAKIAHFKAPKQVIFGELPKTSTGKIQKHELRTRR